VRVNVYAEEMTQKVEIISKSVDGQKFTRLRFYLELPVTVPVVSEGQHMGYTQHKGPFLQKPGDDDSSAVTFWGKRDLRTLLIRAIELLDRHYGNQNREGGKV